LKYNSSGAKQWEQFRNGIGSGNDAAYAIELDYSGNVYVTGTVAGWGTNKDYLTIKYNPAGTQVWSRDYNNVPIHGNDEAFSLAVDSAGNVFVTGNSIGANGTSDFLTVCYNSLGEPAVWTSRYNGAANGNDFANDIKIDKNNNVYITGQSTIS